MRKKPEAASIFVPEAEQPYQIPDNWRWVRLGYPATVIMGQSPDGDSTTDDKAFLPLIGGAADMGELYPNATRYTKKPTKISAKGDVILCVRATLGRPIYSDGSYCLGRGVAAIRPNVGGDKFYRYALICFEQYLLDRATGSTFAQISSSVLKNMPIPLPPLAEQQRIVDRIESLFSKLDAVRDNAQAVLDGFELRKAAILYRAFNGELTAQWRKRAGLKKADWSTKHIGEFSFVTKLAGFEYTNTIAPNLADYGIPLFKGKNVQRGKLVAEFESYIPKAVADELPRSKLTRKCLLIPYVGTIGNVAIFDGSFEAHLGSNVGKVEVNGDTFEEYLLYYLQSGFGYQELTKRKKATAQESISIQAIRDVAVLLPTWEEQREIVRILDSVLDCEQQANNLAEAIISRIDAMKKAILGRAFRGELGTNDPSEESAEFALIV